MSDENIENDKNSMLFLQLVYTFQHAALANMGKIVNPASGKVERDLDQSRGAIDMLMMLKEKSKNNLTKKEADYIEQVILTLQLNYADEARKPQQEEGKKDGQPDTK